MTSKNVGLIGKYHVERTDGSSVEGQKHHGCQYFVLDLTHDPLAFPALAAYERNAREAGYVALADDLLRHLAHLREVWSLSDERLDRSMPILSVAQKKRIAALASSEPETPQ
jgi:hypothetical protein